jgi:dTDP-4-amino-4,6-dideoxygalactose transaminase
VSLISTVTEKHVPLLDLLAQHQAIRDETIAEVVRVIDSQKFILGDDVKALESDLARYCGTPYAIGCASGSDALFLALLAAEVGPGDKVLTTPYTFFATVGAICRAGATPVFADIDPDTFNLDPLNISEALKIHPEVRAIIPVHLFGGCADMDPICAIAEERGITVIEDAAQSLGSEYKQARAGSIGHIGCFSFFPSKNLGAYGDGGMLSTRAHLLAERLLALRVHGAKRKYHHDWIGVNSRLDALQAAVLRVKLKYLDQWTAARQNNAALYAEMLGAIQVPVVLPHVKPYQTRHIYNQFVICGEHRNELQAFLKERGIGTEVYYPVPMHLQTCFLHLGYKRGDFPVSERLAETSLALPVYPELTPEDITYVCSGIRAFYS